jgi:hypothetical protein
VTVKKLSTAELLRRVDNGDSYADIARDSGITRQALYNRVRKLKRKSTTVMASKKVARVVDQKLDAVSQLQKINDHANELLDLCMAWQRGWEFESPLRTLSISDFRPIGPLCPRLTTPPELNLGNAFYNLLPFSFRQSIPCSLRCFSIACLTAAETLMNCLSASSFKAFFIRGSILRVITVCISPFNFNWLFCQ